MNVFDGRMSVQRDESISSSNRSVLSVSASLYASKPTCTYMYVTYM